MSFRTSYRLLAVSVLVAPLLLFCPSCRAQGQNPSVLSRKVESLTLQSATMEDALRALRAINQNQNEILVGFERVAHRRDEPERTVSLSASNSTVEEILNDLCSQDPRYTYELVDGLIVHVHPVNSDSDPQHLLDFRIRDFSVEGVMSPFAVVIRIGQFAPELRSYLDEKQSEYDNSHGIVPSFPGSIIHGNMDPQIRIHLHDMTVRQILNAMVAYSYELYKNAKPDWAGNKPAPTSWMYDFTIDPAATTGLGGYPKWIAF